MLLTFDELSNEIMSLMQRDCLVIWHKNHFTISHPEEEIPEVAIHPEEEQNLVKKKKKSFRKNALQKADLEHLQDKELALLPITDFWDTKNKTCKSEMYRNLGSGKAVASRKVLENKILNDSLLLLD